MCEFIEVFKNETEYLHAMITATQEKVIPAPGRHGMVYVDTVIVAHSNEAEWQKFKADHTNEAILDRIVVVKVPYNLRLSEEVKIYQKIIRNSDFRAHVAPHTLEVASMFAILSRLEPTAKCDLVTKLKLYNGERCREGHTNNRRQRLREDANARVSGTHPIHHKRSTTRSPTMSKATAQPYQRPQSTSSWGRGGPARRPRSSTHSSRTCLHKSTRLLEKEILRRSSTPTRAAIFSRTTSPRRGVVNRPGQTAPRRKISIRTEGFLNPRRPYRDHRSAAEGSARRYRVPGASGAGGYPTVATAQKPSRRAHDSSRHHPYHPKARPGTGAYGEVQRRLKPPRFGSARARRCRLQYSAPSLDTDRRPVDPSVPSRPWPDLDSIFRPSCRRSRAERPLRRDRAHR